MKKFEVGDKVIKNHETWIINEFDSWGRGEGVGVVVEPPFETENSEVDIKWNKGRCFESVEQLIQFYDTTEFFEKLTDDSIDMVDRNSYALITLNEYITDGKIDLVMNIINSEKLKLLHPSLLMSMIISIKPSFFKLAFTNLVSSNIGYTYLNDTYEEIKKNYK
jgi:hypothetical protein